MSQKKKQSPTMKNKMKFWRRMAKKTYEGTEEIRTGKRLRNEMSGMNHQGMLLPIHIWLFKSAGIATPEFDKRFAERYNKNSDVQDVIPVIEGNLNATPA